MKLKLSNDRYELYYFEREGKNLVYLRDCEEKTDSLGVTKLSVEEIELLWKRQSEKGFCLPCELLLHLEPKVLKSENYFCELGISLELLEKVKSLLEGRDG